MAFNLWLVGMWINWQRSFDMRLERNLFRQICNERNRIIFFVKKRTLYVKNRKRRDTFHIKDIWSLTEFAKNERKKKSHTECKVSGYRIWLTKLNTEIDWRRCPSLSQKSENMHSFKRYESFSIFFLMHFRKNDSFLNFEII